MLARPAREITELGGAENSFLRMRGKLRRSAGSGMLKDDPLMRGSNAGSTYNELWRAEKLIPQNEKELRRSAGSGMLIDNPLSWGEQC